LQKKWKKVCFFGFFRVFSGFFRGGRQYRCGGTWGGEITENAHFWGFLVFFGNFPENFPKFPENLVALVTFKMRFHGLYTFPFINSEKSRFAKNCGKKIDSYVLFERLSPETSRSQNAFLNFLKKKGKKVSNFDDFLTNFVGFLHFPDRKNGEILRFFFIF
jgi:hypothetical protein